MNLEMVIRKLEVLGKERTTSAINTTFVIFTSLRM